MSRFQFSDFIQQALGAILLAGPFVVTDEVWTLGERMSMINGAACLAMAVVIGYFSLFEADTTRTESHEEHWASVPVRLLSLVGVSMVSVVLVAFLLEAPLTQEASLSTTFNVLSIGTMFSVIGAAASDSVL